MLPDVTVREAVVLVQSATDLNELIGGEIDPSEVVKIGPDPDFDGPS